MDGEQEQRPVEQPTIQPDPSDAERRLLAQLAGRRQLAASVVRRLSARPGAPRGVPLVDQRHFAPRLPLAVPHVLLFPNRLVKRDVDWSQVERFWWKRMAPHSAMLHRRRPLATGTSISASTGVSRSLPIGETPQTEADFTLPETTREFEAATRRDAGREGATPPAEQHVRTAPGLDAPAEQPMRTAPGLHAPAEQHVRAAPGLHAPAEQHVRTAPGLDAPAEQHVRTEPGLGTPARRVASAVWRRVAAVLSPSRSAVPAEKAPAPALDRSSAPSVPPNPPELRWPDGPEPADSLAPLPPTPPRVAPAASAVEESSSGSHAHESPATGPLPDGTLARAVDQATAAQALPEDRRLASGAALPTDEPRTPADEIAPLATRLTRRMAASMGMLARTSQAARPSPSRLFWWPGTGVPSALPAPVPIRRIAADAQLPLALPPRAGGGEADTSVRDRDLPAHPVAIRAPGLLGAVLGVHRAAVTPTTRLVHFADHVRHTQRFATAGVADERRWRVRSALPALDAQPVEARSHSLGETSEQTHQTRGEAAPEMHQAPGVGMLLTPALEHPGQHWPSDPPSRPRRGDREATGSNPAPSSLPAKASPAPPGRGVSLIGTLVSRLSRLARRATMTAPQDASESSATTEDAAATLPGRALVADSPHPRSSMEEVGEAPLTPTTYTPPPRPHTSARVVRPGQHAAEASPKVAPLRETQPPATAGLVQRMRRRLLDTRPASQPALDLAQAPVLTRPSTGTASSAPRRPPASPPHVLPARPSDVSDAELAAVIRRLPAPMAAAALAAGVLGDAAAQATLERSAPAHQPLAPRIASPVEARSSPVAMQHNVLAPSAPARAWSSQTQATTGQRGSPTPPHIIPEHAWSAPLETEHAPLTNYSSPSSTSIGGGGAATALAAGGFSAAPLERDVAPVAAPAASPGAVAHTAGRGETHPAANAAAPDAKNLDHLAEEVLNKLRWRLSVERERLMG